MVSTVDRPTEPQGGDPENCTCIYCKVEALPYEKQVALMRKLAGDWHALNPQVQEWLKTKVEHHNMVLFDFGGEVYLPADAYSHSEAEAAPVLTPKTPTMQATEDIPAVVAAGSGLSGDTCKGIHRAFHRLAAEHGRKTQGGIIFAHRRDYGRWLKGLEIQARREVEKQNAELSHTVRPIKIGVTKLCISMENPLRFLDHEWQDELLRQTIGEFDAEGNPVPQMVRALECAREAKGKCREHGTKVVYRQQCRCGFCQYCLTNLGHRLKRMKLPDLDPAQPGRLRWTTTQTKGVRP